MRQALEAGRGLWAHIAQAFCTDAG